MREVTWRMFIDDLIDTLNKMQSDLDQIKQDMADFRQDTTDIIDSQYDMDKKLNQTLAIIKDLTEE